LKGIYSLIILLKKDVRCRIAALGLFRFSKGVYLYTGSARGQGSTSIERRIERHLGKHKRKFWHIDHLLGANGCGVFACIYAETVKDEECVVNSKIQELTCGDFPVNHFGSSDCNCCSHLVWLPKHDIAKAMGNITEAYRRVGLEPKSWNLD
jgi:Uri superfamily endonuclease